MKAILTLTVSCLISISGVASASAATPTQTETFTGVYSPTLAQTVGYLAYGSTFGGAFHPSGQELFASEPAMVGNVLGPISFQVPTVATNLRGAVFSVYNLGANEVTLTLDTGVAATILALSQSFSTAFSGYDEPTFVQNLESVTSSDMATAAASAKYLSDFFFAFQNDFPAVVGNTANATLVNFSNATTGGTAALNFTPTPEPATWALLAVGLGAGWILRRRGVSSRAAR